jgi:hypothetical protein
MCIVVIKKSGILPPTKKTLRNCFDANPDGAGLMYNYKGRVIIDKGFFSFKSYWKRLQGLNFGIDDVVVYHFRIATAGGINIQNCHPFPISDNCQILGAPQIETDIGLAHNGIINIPAEKGLSDTSTFIKSALYGLKKDLLAKRSAVFNLVSLATKGSKLAFLYGAGEVVTTGDNWITEDSGLVFSNTSYQEILWYKDKRYNAGFSWPDKWFKDGETDKSTLYCTECGGELLKVGNLYHCQDCETVYE